MLTETPLAEDGLELVWQRMSGGNPWRDWDTLTTDEADLLAIGEWCADLALACANAAIDSPSRGALPEGLVLPERKGDRLAAAFLDLGAGDESPRRVAAEGASISLRAAQHGQPHVAAHWMLRTQCELVASLTLGKCPFGGRVRDRQLCAEARRLRNRELAERVRALEVA